MATSDLTCERLRSGFHYDVDTGEFTRIACADRSHVGDVMGSLDGWGYILFRAFGRKYKAHRLAWLYVFGEWPRQQLDHIDGDKLNNRIGNLRDVPQEMNQHNRRTPRADSILGIQGVRRMGNRFYAQITVGGKRHSLGGHHTCEEAIEAYKAAKKLLHAGYLGH